MIPRNVKPVQHLYCSAWLHGPYDITGDETTAAVEPAACSTEVVGDGQWWVTGQVRIILLEHMFTVLAYIDDN